MQFTNSITQDFEIPGNVNLFYYDSQDALIAPNVQTSQTYVQANARANAAKMECGLANFTTEMADLVPSANQGTVTKQSGGSLLKITVNDYDPNEYLAIFLGNVLIAFVVPIH